MLAILGGLGAAISWAASTICSSRSTRMIGPASALAWVMIAGTVALAGPALADRPEGSVTPESVLMLLVSAATYLVGLVLAYRALRIGRVAIVAPILSTDGALAAVLAILLGESVTIELALTLGAIALGVVLTATERTVADEPAPDPRLARRAWLLAISSACVFAVCLVAIGRAAAVLPATWVILAPRLLGVFVIALPLILAGRLRLTRTAAPLVVVAGIAEVTGGLAFAAGAGSSIAITAVLSSQFATIAAAVAFVLFHERMTRLQVGGAAVVIAGVAVLGAIRA